MRQFACLLVFLASFADLAAQEVRTWTDAQGRKMQAQFVREVDGDVTFIKEGKLITFPLEQLSEADQKFIREAETEKKVEEPARPAGAPAKDAGQDGLLPPADSFSPAEAKSNLTKQRMVAEERTWRDVRGQQTVGKFVRMHDGNVVLLRGGRVVTISFFSLSRIDREYLRDLLTARGEASQLPAGIPEESDPPAGPTPAPQQVERTEPQPPEDAGSEAGTTLRNNGNPNRERNSSEPTDNEPNIAGKTPRARPEPAGRLAMRPAEISIPTSAESSAQKAERARLSPAGLGIILVFLAVVVSIGCTVGALILRAAVALYNTMAGNADSGYGVPEPGFGEAIGINLATSLVQAAAGFGVGLFIGSLGAAISWDEKEIKFVSMLVSYPLGLVLMAGMLSSMLPTTMGRAILVTLCHLVVSIFVYGIIIAGFYFIWGGGN